MRLFTFLIITKVLIVFCPAQHALAQAKNNNTFQPRIQQLEMELLGISSRKILATDSKVLEARESSIIELITGYSCLSKKNGVFGLWGDNLETQSDKCKKSLERLKVKMPNSPLITCIKNGQSSEECREKSLIQQAVSWRDAESYFNLFGENQNLPPSFASNFRNNNIATLKAEAKTADDKVASLIENGTENELNQAKRQQAIHHNKVLNAACPGDAIIIYRSIEVLGLHFENFSKTNPDPELERLNKMIEKYKKDLERKNKSTSGHPFDFGKSNNANTFNDSTAHNQRNNRSSSGRMAPTRNNVIHRNNTYVQPAQNTREPFEEISSNSLSKENQENELVHEQQMVRVRILSNECFETMQSTLNALPLHPGPICIREGHFSPQCHTARDRFAREMRQQGYAPLGIEF